MKAIICIDDTNELNEIETILFNNDYIWYSERKNQKQIHFDISFFMGEIFIDDNLICILSSKKEFKELIDDGYIYYDNINSFIIGLRKLKINKINECNH